MTKVAIISAYYGKLPSTFDLWVKTCEYNPTIDFFIFTDQTYITELKNVHIVNIPFEELGKIAEEKMGIKVKLKSPYKLCDLKPMYGCIFEDYLKEYDYWGNCDIDLFWGNLRKFFDEYELEKYERFLKLGHLTLYKNTKEINERFKLCEDFKSAMATENHVAFDEVNGIDALYQKNKYPSFEKNIMADITVEYTRFRLTRGNLNYKYQVFYWEDGKVYRAYLKDGEIQKDEFIYIHIQKRKFEMAISDIKNIKSFFVCNGKVFDKDKDKITKEEIKKYNPYKGAFIELIDFYNLKAKRFMKRFQK